MPTSGLAPEGAASAAERKILYYRDPSGAPYWSAEPKKDAQGRDYLPVFEDEEISFEPGGKKPAAAAGGPRKILYYRNPMGLPDTSPIPKKDWMGMDYIPVYEGEEQDDGKTIKVSLDKVQRSGVRTETVEARVIVRPVRAVGTVMHDESRLTIVTMRSDGFVEDLFVSTNRPACSCRTSRCSAFTARIFNARRSICSSPWARPSAAAGSRPPTPIEISRAPCSGCAISLCRRAASARCARRAANPRTLDWPAPATGDVIEKKIINGQRVQAGQELYRIADHAHLWVIADVAEADLPAIKIGTRASVTVRAYAAEPIEGEVTFIYPELRMETRTARVRIEIPNPDGRLKVDMYADVVFQAGAGEEPCIAVPVSAVIDSGTRQVVLVAKGEGRFEPRADQARPPRRRLRRGARRRRQGRGGRHRCHLPDRRRKQPQGRAASVHAAGGAEMIAALIRWSAHNVFLVGIATVFVTLAGIYAVSRVPLDAIPDLSDVQVIVYTEYSGQAPQVVEDQVTYPLTTAMLSVPKSRVVRGFSFFGVSFVYVIFEDGTDLYWARSRVLEYLSSAARRLPAGVAPSLGPDATGVGWVYQYVVRGAQKSLAELRTIQDWYIRYGIAKAEGVAEVASVGGFVKQYSVVIDPRRLQALGIPLAKIREAIRTSNMDVGGRTVELAETEFAVRGRGYIKSLSDLEQIVVKSERGVPVLLRDVARVELAPGRTPRHHRDGRRRRGRLRHRAAALRRERARGDPQRQGSPRRDRAEPAPRRHDRCGL